jgi:hypothetical protein
MKNKFIEKCEHEPSGKWQVSDGKSFAECKKCGAWYPTTLFEPTIK